MQGETVVGVGKARQSGLLSGALTLVFRAISRRERARERDTSAAAGLGGARNDAPFPTCHLG